jgi:hypothetical protein
VAPTAASAHLLQLGRVDRVRERPHHGGVMQAGQLGKLVVGVVGPGAFRVGPQRQGDDHEPGWRL